ncbi:MAG: GTP-binding protein, partial [Actinomycetaceae bacterium]|nr:GTP-binding protein [Actinomycetaceae bacterium]
MSEAKKLRKDLRNVAIVAHVDHGKTTLVDAMLWQSGAFGERATVEKTGTRVMDSGDLEREKGITILAKNTAIEYRGEAAQRYGSPDGVTINVIDTPGHADFGGEVERGLSMVDGVVLLVDASEGPLPQTRFVLRKALEASLPVITVVNKVDRPDARIVEVEGEAQDLLLSLYADLDDADDDLLDQLLEIPVIYCSAKAGYADILRPEDGTLPHNTNLEPLFEAILKYIPAPSFDEGAPLVAQVTNLDASPFLGRLALTRIYSGELVKGATVGWTREDGSLSRVRISELLITKGLERESAERAHAGDIVAVAGIEDVTIGDCLVDPDNPQPLPPIHVDDPAISMTIGINTSPLAGKEKGHKLTARQVKDRLDAELVGNVSIRVLPTDRPETWEVQDR